MFAFTVFRHLSNTDQDNHDCSVWTNHTRQSHGCWKLRGKNTENTFVVKENAKLIWNTTHLISKVDWSSSGKEPIKGKSQPEIKKKQKTLILLWCSAHPSDVWDAISLDGVPSAFHSASSASALISDFLPIYISPRISQTEALNIIVIRCGRNITRLRLAWTCTDMFFLLFQYAQIYS